MLVTTEIEKVPTKLERATKIKDELMKDGVHYGKVVDKQSDFLYLSGASLLADVFENVRNTCISYYELDPAN